MLGRERWGGWGESRTGEFLEDGGDAGGGELGEEVPALRGFAGAVEAFDCDEGAARDGGEEGGEGGGHV